MRWVLLVLVLMLTAAPVAAEDYIIAGRPRPAAAGCGEDFSSDADLIAWYKLEEASGNRADSTANGNTLTENDDPIGRDTTNFKEGAASLDNPGSFNDWMTLADASMSSEFPGNNTDGGIAAFSITFWLRPNNTSCYRFIHKGTAGSFVLRSNCDSIGLRMFADFSGTDCGLLDSAGGNLTADTWYHVAFIAPAGGTCRFLINGTEEAATGSPTGTLVTNTSDFVVGGDRLDGQVDEVAVFSRELTNDEAQDIYNCGVDGAGLP